MAYTRTMNGKVPQVLQELHFDETPTPGSLNPVTSGGVAEAVNAISDVLPEGASADNKLVDQATLDEATKDKFFVYKKFNLSTSTTNCDISFGRTIPKNSLLSFRILYDASVWSGGNAYMVLKKGSTTISTTYQQNGYLLVKASEDVDNVRIGFGAAQILSSGTIHIYIRLADEMEFHVLNIATLNIGAFSFGTSSTPTITAEEAPAYIAHLRSVLSSEKIDLIGYQEWAKNVVDNDSNYTSASQVLFNYFYNGYSNTYVGGYAGKAIASMLPVSKNFEEHLMTNTDGLNRTFCDVSVRIGGEDVMFVSTHLALTAEARAAEMAELISYYESYPHVIIVMDSNVASDSELVPFKMAGYKLANADWFGTFKTYIGNDDSPAGDKPTDNIVVKGFVFESVEEFGDTDISDHAGLVARISKV